MTAKLATHVRTSEHAAIIDLSGNITREVEKDLLVAYEQAKQYGTDVIIMNFTDVDYINSTGIALIVSLLGQARTTKTQLTVFGLSEHYTNIFTITRLSDFMTIVPDEHTALTQPSKE